MRMLALSRLILPILLAPGLALAQAPAPTTENVTVTGTRDRQVIDKFVDSMAAPTRVAGKITRWQDGICPQTVGLNPAAVKFVNARLKAVARQAGAPVDPDPHCAINIEIVFTTTPQVMMDNVRKKKPNLLGYADNQQKVAALAHVSRPIQAWYLTSTRDDWGNVYLDIAHRKGVVQQDFPPNAIATSSTGSRLGDGIRSGFQHVIVAADPAKLTDYAIGQIADYISLVALSQVAAPGSCQPLASILNLMVPGCNSVPDGLSANDRSFLRGLYDRMNPGLNVGLQRGQIAAQILAGAQER